MAGDFFAPASHGFVRIATCAPQASAGDIAANLAATIDFARRAAGEGADLALFPELGLSSYAIDDLHLQEAQLDAVERSIADLAAMSADLPSVLVVGAPLRRNGRLYNCALAIARGHILGVVPKSFLPNYREYYEKRWFAPGVGLAGLDIAVAGRSVPFGVDLVFASSRNPDFMFGVEICEDLWSPTPPSTQAALAGALILCNLSASNITIGKARERAMLVRSQSARAVCAYAYAAAGPGESTTDLAWDGQTMIAELGELIAESARFAVAGTLLVADVDVQRVRLERMRTGTFNDAARAAGDPETRVRRIEFDHRRKPARGRLRRAVPRYPFVPSDPVALDQDCYEAFNIQVEGLATRYRATGGETMVIGVSGGLDSTHALIVAARACDRMGVPRAQILGFTMPGFATGDETKANAWALMRALGVTGEEIDIRPAARQLLADIGHPFAAGDPVHDVTFENVQAGLRTDYLFRLANQRRGFVIGTGDLSELALGWSTYGVGDQMSHYGVNPGVPKTLIQHLIRWTIATGQFDAATDQVLAAILDTEISPELVPADASGAMQSTEARIGPYALHDFFLHHIVRHGLPPAKVAFLAWSAWHDAQAGDWPAGLPADKRPAYDIATIRRWLEVFLTRFFGFSQFKRSALPNGPKVSAGGALSPRGDWRAPSDGNAKAWLDDLAKVPTEE